MADVIQRSFAGGEIAPSLHARADQSKYATGLRTCRNFVVHKHGGVSNRSGTMYVNESKDSSKRSIVVLFRFNNTQTYAMEFGDKYIRFHRNGGTIIVTDSDAPAYNGATAYVIGDLCTSASVRYYCIKNTTGNAPPNATYWYPLTGNIYEIPTPYVEADLEGLRFTQSADVVSIVHESHDPMDLSRYGNVKWILSTTSFAPPVAKPTGGAATAGTAGTTVWRYKVSAMETGTAEEGEASDMFSCTGGIPTSAAPNVLSWTAVTGAGKYGVYKEITPGNGIYAMIGMAATTSFNDINIAPSSTIQPVTIKTPFSGVGDKPSEVTYFQQRRVYASTLNDPEFVVASRSDSFVNMNVSTPLKDDDSVSFSLAGSSINRVTGLVGLRKLVILTESGEWTVEGDGNGVMTPSAINPTQQSYNGAAKKPALVIGSELLYVQARGNVVRNLGYELQTDGYKGDDITIFANHLFEGKTIVSWAYCQIPDSIVWVAMDDGGLLGLTYIKSQQMWGWHRHDLNNGFVESVCSVPESSEDVLYMVVRRTINGVTKRYIEYLHSRRVTNVVDAHFVDSGIAYDGTILDGSSITLSGGVLWDNTETLVCTRSAGGFVAGDVGNQIVIYDANGVAALRLSIVSYTSPTVVGVISIRDVPAEYRSTALFDWARAVDTISGLSYLEGEVVSVLADGFVVSNGYDAPLVTVVSGSITLPRPYVKIRIGLPIEADFETLDLDGSDQRTLLNKESIVRRVDVVVQSSRGIWAGPNSDELVEHKQRELENYDEPTSLFTGTVGINITSEYTKGGRIFIRQRDPLPLTILAAIPVGDFGGAN